MENEKAKTEQAQEAETKPETAGKEPEKAPTVEELTAKMNALEIELAKSKAALSKVNSEAADWKRQLREKQSEQERFEAERAEAEKKQAELLAEYQKRDTINTYKGKLIEAGVDVRAAELMANALPVGVGEEYFAATKEFLQGQKQAFEKEAIAKQAGLSVGMPPTSTDAMKEETNRQRKFFGLPPIP